MSDDWDDDLLDEGPAVRMPSPSRRRPQALVVEDDPAQARVCSRRLTSLGMDVRVVWTAEDAADALSRRGASLAFVYADSRLVGGSPRAAAGAIRSLRATTPVVVASRDVCDVLTFDAVVVCKPFTTEQFDAAFDAAVIDESSRVPEYEPDDAPAAPEPAAAWECAVPALQSA